MLLSDICFLQILIIRASLVQTYFKSFNFQKSKRKKKTRIFFFLSPATLKHHQFKPITLFQVALSLWSRADTISKWFTVQRVLSLERKMTPLMNHFSSSVILFYSSCAHLFFPFVAVSPPHCYFYDLFSFLFLCWTFWQLSLWCLLRWTFQELNLKLLTLTTQPLNVCYVYLYAQKNDKYWLNMVSAPGGLSVALMWV